MGSPARCVFDGAAHNPVATKWTFMTDPVSTSGAAAWPRLGRVTGLAGLATIVPILVAVVGTREEPSFTATATEFLTYYRSPDTDATPFRSFLVTVGLVTFV